MVIIDIDGIDKGFDDMTAEERIRPVSGCELMQEEQDPVLVYELRLGEAETGMGKVSKLKLIKTMLTNKAVGE